MKLPFLDYEAIIWGRQCLWRRRKYSVIWNPSPVSKAWNPFRYLNHMYNQCVRLSKNYDHYYVYCSYIYHDIHITEFDTIFIYWTFLSYDQFESRLLRFADTLCRKNKLYEHILEILPIIYLDILQNTMW